MFTKMEQNPPVLAKKVWSLMRGVYLMIKKKGILKRKLLLDLNMMIKKKLSHHHHNRQPHDDHHLSFTSPPPGEYEFSCSNSPSNNSNNPFSLFSIFHKKHHSTNQQDADLDITAINAAVLKAMEMIHSDSERASPAVLPGFGRSPMVRQLRVTDSPFPLSGVDDDSHHVDEAAEQFISRFYNNLRQQNSKGAFRSG